MQEQNLPKPTTPEGNSVPSVEDALAVDSYEQAPNSTVGPETMPAAGDSVNQAGPVQQHAPVDLPQPISQQMSAPATQKANDSTLPTVADDVDVIEKVWVDKAKTIVKQTKDDPYTQEKQVSSLQEDYQKKRYGKEKNNG
jgi:hypothetical protein